MDYSLTFENLALIASEEKYNLVPVYVELLADTETPVSAYLKVSDGGAGFLLESVTGGVHQARYSFIGTNPDSTLVQNGVDPLLAIEKRLSTVRLFPVADLPTFTGGAMGYLTYDCVKYFESSVKIPDKDIIKVPESVFMFFNTIIVFDNLRHSIKVVSHVNLADLEKEQSTFSSSTTSSSSSSASSTASSPLRARYDAAIASISAVLTRLSQPQQHSNDRTNLISIPCLKPTYTTTSTMGGASVHTNVDPTAATATEASTDKGNNIAPSSSSASSSSSSSPSPSSTSSSSSSRAATALVSNQGRDGYCSMVSSLKEHIKAGNIIQAVPSQRMSRPLAANTSAFDIYRQFRMVNPSPYMFYLKVAATPTSSENKCSTETPTQYFEIVGASPEQLVKVDEHRKVTTHPIAGTRRRGATPEADEALAKELLASEKERAEHIMLVDLGRNDVGRVAATGSVNVDSLMHIEKYSHVMHIVSHVSGKLRDDLSVYDALRSVFPAGTVSGAPKVRAMQLVAGLEGERRGVYAGCVGYVSYSGVLDTAIAIRTLLVKDGQVHLQAGGGIVYDSEEKAEEEETVNKMRGAEVAVLRAENAAAARAASAAVTSTTSASDQSKKELS